MNLDSIKEINLSDNPPETPILNRIGNGDRNVYLECVEKYGNPVWHLAKRYTDSQIAAEAMTLEIFREIWKCAADFHSEHCKEETFILRIAYRCLPGKINNWNPSHK